jgi:integrase
MCKAVVQMALRMVGLSRDPKTGSWRARKVIPADVRAAYGKKNAVKRWDAALKPAEAKAVWRDWLDDVEAKIERLRSMAKTEPVRLSKREVVMYAGQWYRQEVEAHSENPGDEHGWEAALDAMVPDEAHALPHDAIYEGPWVRQAFVVNDIDDMLSAQGLVLATASREALLDEAHDLFRDLCRLMIRRAQGDYGKDKTPARLPDWNPEPVAAPVRAKVAISLNDLFDGYANDGDNPPARSTVKAWRRQIKHLVAFLGHDDAAALTSEDVERWRDHLAATPMKDGGKRSARTINDTYLAAVRTVLNWGVRRKRLPANVATGVGLTVRKAVRLRDRSLTRDEALTILRGTLATPPAKFTAEHARARRWVPWLCAYTGARVNEITQLRKEDLFREEGVWVIRITPEAGSVKDKEARKVPLHSHILDQGFVEVVNALPAGPIFYDPRRARGGSDENPQSNKVGERIAKWVRELGVDDPNIGPNHAWRHRFKTVARTARLDSEARRAIQGHAPDSVGASYGEWEMTALSHEVEKLPRYDLTTA